jgi:dTDP-4-amino-4,6-dideoxygalactose transaminase
MGDGGAVVCKNREIAKRLKELSQYGWSKRYLSRTPYGKNSRMDEVQAAILRFKLRHLDQHNAIRRSIVGKYASSAPGDLKVWHDNSRAFVAHLAVATHPERARIREALRQSGIITDIHYPTLDCDQPSESDLPKTIHDLTVSRKVINEIFTLPCFPEMTEQEIDYICVHLSNL